MATSPTHRMFERLRRAALMPGGVGPTDGQLLEEFIARRDEAAFEVLVRRHGPMVLGVCRRVLRNEADADDAFQATFLVLVRKAAVVRPREQVGNWLYGVAYRTALKARAAAARRRAKEKQARPMPHPGSETEDAGQELRRLLDEELNRLPDKYRVAVVLCELEGRPRKQVARQLGVPEGTLSSRLATARRLLAGRLACRGVALAGAALAALGGETARAAVSAALRAETVKAAALVAAGQAVTGVASATVAALAEGVLKDMLLTKLKVATLVLLAVAALMAGAVLFHAGAAEPPGDKKDEPKAESGPPGAVADHVAVRRFEGHTDGVMVVAFSPDGKRALSGGVCYGDRDPTVRLWEVGTGKELLKLEGHTEGVYSLAFLAGGKQAVSGSAAGTMRIWDLETGKELQCYEGHEGTVYGLDVTRDGKLLLTGGEDSTVRLWDLETGKEVRRFEGHEGKVRAVAFSADGKQAASGTILGDATLRIWDVETGKEVSKYTVASTPAKGRRNIGILYGGFGGFAPGGFGPFPFPDEPGGIASVAFSPDGKLVLAGCMDNVLRVFELSTGKERKLEGHEAQLHGAVFTPDGKRILSASYDKTVRLWDVESGKEVCRFFGHTNWVWGVAVSPDGKLGLSGSLDKTVRLWQLPK
jgi:RNA polymerase sigma factor (sigma-70 family)